VLDSEQPCVVRPIDCEWRPSLANLSVLVNCVIFRGDNNR